MYMHEDVSATLSVEVDVMVTAEVDPGQPTTRDDPGYDATVENLSLDDVVVNGKSILIGVDMTSGDVRTLVYNLLNALYAEAESAALEAYHKWLP